MEVVGYDFRVESEQLAEVADRFDESAEGTLAREVTQM